MVKNKKKPLIDFVINRTVFLKGSEKRFDTR